MKWPRKQKLRCSNVSDHLIDAWCREVGLVIPFLQVRKLWHTEGTQEVAETGLEPRPPDASVCSTSLLCAGALRWETGSGDQPRR